MNNRQRNNTRALSQLPERIAGSCVLSERIILLTSAFLSFADFRNLVRSVWPNNDESDIIQAKLWELSTHNAEIPFINGKLLNIKYNYDPWREKEDTLLINLKSLTPIFGDIIMPAMDKFKNVSAMKDLVRTHAHINRCFDYRYSSCSCHLKNYNPNAAKAFGEPVADVCPCEHSHHYCSQHVNHWIQFFLHPLLMAKEENKYPDEDTIHSYLSFLNHTIIL